VLKVKWQVITLDFASLPLIDGYSTCLIVVDKFSKKIKLIPLRKDDTQTDVMLTELCEKVFRIFGILKMIVAD
jgi:hypothetical protein